MAKGLKPGDYAEIINTWGHQFKMGQLVRILKDEEQDFYSAESLDKTMFQVIKYDSVKLALAAGSTESKVLEWANKQLDEIEDKVEKLEKVKKEVFHVGDKVKVADNKSKIKHYFRVGTIGTVKVLPKAGRTDSVIVENNDGACWAVATSDLTLHKTASKPKKDGKTTRSSKKSASVSDSKSIAE